MHETPHVRLVFGSTAASVLVLLAPSVLAGASLATTGARLRFVQPDAPADPDPLAADAPAMDAERSLLSGWTGSLELGLTGASGNNERFNIRAAAGATRETERHADQISLTYTYASDEGDETENRFDATARHDWKFVDSPWRVYFGGSFEYDEFQDWDMRVSLGPGVGYEAIETARTSLLLRAGLVATLEIGGADNAWTPEADLGFDLTHQITERQSLTASFDFYPALDDLGPYRFEGDLAWMIEIDPEANLYLKLGLEDRYDSSPGPDKKRNDLTYYATVGWAF